MALILGLDVRATSVRATLAKVRGRDVEVLRYLETAIIPSASPEGREATVRDAVSELMALIKPAPDRIVTSLSGFQVSLRTVSIPQAAVRRAPEVLPFELESVLPFDVKEAVIDYQPITTASGESELMVAAAPAERLRAHIDTMAAAQVSPREVAAGAAALDGVLPVVPDLSLSGLRVVMDVGADQTELCGIVGEACVYARTLAVRMDDARTGRLEKELKQTLAALKAAVSAPLEAVYITGDAAADEHAARWFSERLQTEVKILPLPEAETGSSDFRNRHAISTALACRAAGKQKRINLRRGEFAATPSAGDIRKNAKLLAICAVFILVAFAFSVTMRWRSLTAEHAVLEKQLQETTERAFGEGTGEPEAARALLEGRGGASDPLPKFDAYDVLETISDRVPADIQHDVRKLVVELDDDGLAGRFELRGIVASIAERDRIATSLGEYQCFHDVQKGTTTPAPGGTGVAYPIQATVRCPGVVREDDKKKAGGEGENAAP